MAYELCEKRQIYGDKRRFLYAHTCIRRQYSRGCRHNRCKRFRFLVRPHLCYDGSFVFYDVSFVVQPGILRGCPLTQHVQATRHRLLAPRPQGPSCGEVMGSGLLEQKYAKQWLSFNSC